MTVDSEAIFALMELREPRPACPLGAPRRDGGRMDRRARRARALPRARTLAPAVDRQDGSGLFFASTRRALAIVEAALAGTTRGARGARGSAPARRRWPNRARAPLPPRSRLPRERATSRPSERRARPCRASSGSLRSRRQPPLATRRAGRPVPSSRRRSRTRYWNAVHAPRGTSSIRYTCHSERSVASSLRAVGPVRHLRQPAESTARARHPASTARSRRSSPCSTSNPPRGARSRASRTCARRATRTEASVGARRDRAPSAYGRARRRERGAARGAPRA